MSAGDFRDLEVWKKSKEMAILVYRMTAQGPLSKDFGLRDQMRRAAVSICSNIAEGNDRNTDRDTVRFLYMAKGSAAELMSQMEIAQDIGYVEQSEARKVVSNCEEIARMLRGLIKYRDQSL